MRDFFLSTSLARKLELLENSLEKNPGRERRMQIVAGFIYLERQFTSVRENELRKAMEKSLRSHPAKAELFKLIKDFSMRPWQEGHGYGIPLAFDFSAYLDGRAERAGEIIRLATNLDGNAKISQLRQELVESEQLVRRLSQRLHTL
jgi:hypothetical protein